MKQLVTFALILALAACTASSPSSRPEVAPDSSPEFPETIITRDVPGEIQFDWDEAMQNIYICGRKIHFPENAEDLLGQLGEGFAFAQKPGGVLDIGINTENEVSDKLLYKGREMIGVCFDDCTRENYLADGKIKSLQVLIGIPSGFYLYGLPLHDHLDKESIAAFLGQPTEEETLSIRYRQDAQRGIFFIVTEKCTAISIKNKNS